MDAIVRLLLQLRHNKPSTPAKSSLDHVVRSDSFTVQMSPAFYNKNQPSTTDKNEGQSDTNEQLLSRQNVRYIFKCPIDNCSRPTSLKMLQKPLTDLYLAYVDKKGQSLPCVIDILDNGLKLQHLKSEEADIVEVFNEFHTIAYWAAVRCVIINSSHTISAKTNSACAVQIGFFPFTENGQCVIQEYSSGSFVHLDDQADLLTAEHPPLFACVMRDNSDLGPLQCHVFVCNDSQQAINLASKLYESLTNNLKSKLQRKIATPTPPKKGTDQSMRKKYATVVCSSCKKKEVPASANRSKSFSQFLSKLRRLNVNKDNQVPNLQRQSNNRQSISKSSTNRHKQSMIRQSIRRSSIVKRFRTNKKAFNKPILVPGGNASGELNDDKCKNKADDVDAGYHSIPQQTTNEFKPQLAKLSMSAPKWMSNEFQLKKPPKNNFLSKSLDLDNDNWTNDEFDVEDDCQTYAEIESLSGFSNSEDEDVLTEIDSLESKESWGRFKRTKISIRQLQIQTINKMLGLATQETQLKSDGQSDNKTIDDLVKKDAEIASTLQQLLQVRSNVSAEKLPIVNSNGHNKMTIAKKDKNAGARPSNANSKVIQHGEWLWGKSTFLP